MPDRDDEAEVYVHGFANGAFARLPEVDCPTTFAYGERTDAFGAPGHGRPTPPGCPAPPSRPSRGSATSARWSGPTSRGRRAWHALGAHDGTPPS